MKVLFDPTRLTPGAGLWVGLLIGGIGLWVWGARRRGVSPGALAWRALSAGLVCLALLSSGFRWVRPARDGSVAVLWDESASMHESDGPGGETRWQVAQSAWKEARPYLPGRPVHHVVGTTARPIEEALLTEFRPQAPGFSFAALPSVSTGVKGIVLFSDGRSSDPIETPPGIPVFAVGVGGPSRGPDVAVESVEASPVAFVGRPMEVNVTLTSDRPLNDGAKVTLWEGARERARASVLLSTGAATATLTLEPPKAGIGRYEVRVDPVSGESRTANNRRSFAVDVRRDRVRTLYVAGRPGPHYHFLRAQLKTDPRVELVSFVILRDPEDRPDAPESDLSLIPFPTAEALVAQLPTFDVVVLENMDHTGFGLPPPFFRALDQWVRAGGGLLGVGEPASWTPAGSTDEFLLDLLPWVPGPPVSGPERFRLARGEGGHPLLSLGEETVSTARWASLAPLEGSGRFYPGVKEGTRVLAVDPVGGNPVLAELSWGRGRVVGLANSTSWRWALDGGRRGEGPAVYQLFWENIIRWLAASPGSGPLRLERPAGPVAPGDPWTLRLWVPPDAVSAARVWVIDSEGGRSRLAVRPAMEPGLLTAEWAPLSAGFYEVRATAGEAYRDRMGVEVLSPWDESRDVRPDFARLETLARRSGGRFVMAGDLRGRAWRRWGSSFRWEDRPQGMRGEALFLFLALAALGGEWIYRRKMGIL